MSGSRSPTRAASTAACSGASVMTTSAPAISSAARTVSSPGSPGPVPTKATDPDGFGAAMGGATRAAVAREVVLRAAAGLAMLFFTVLLVDVPVVLVCLVLCVLLWDLLWDLLWALPSALLCCLRCVLACVLAWAPVAAVRRSVGLMSRPPA